MAVTNITPIHCSGNRSANTTINDCVNYALNEFKTENGKLTCSYGCDTQTAAEQFLFTKEQYHENGGVKLNKKSDILLYHMYQSFKPGEIDPEKALEMSNELAMGFTGGNHAFVVGVHTDREHVHCHIYFSAVKMGSDGKFHNPWNSYKDVRDISDKSCLEHLHQFNQCRQAGENHPLLLCGLKKKKRKKIFPQAGFFIFVICLFGWIRS